MPSASPSWSGSTLPGYSRSSSTSLSTALRLLPLSNSDPMPSRASGARQAGGFPGPPHASVEDLRCSGVPCVLGSGFQRADAWRRMICGKSCAHQEVRQVNESTESTTSVRGLTLLVAEEPEDLAPVPVDPTVRGPGWDRVKSFLFGTRHVDLESVQSELTRV